MNRSIHRRTIVLAIAIAIASQGCSKPAAVDGPPNVILISLDTLRADHLGSYGYDRPTSPNLDRLAEESFLFLNCYAPSTWTLPSHASLFTGELPMVHGAINQTDYSRLPRTGPPTTLGDLAAEAGYTAVGFTQGGNVAGDRGFNRGFTIYKDRCEGPWGPFATAREWLRLNSPEQFFLFLHTYQVHTPYNPTKEFRERFTDPAYDGPYPDQYFPTHENYGNLTDRDKQHVVNLYDAEIALIDHVVGDFVSSLKNMGLYDNSLIIVTSDHGEQFWEHGENGHGMSLYDEELHVPLIIKMPKSAAIGEPQRVDALVSLHDVFATICEVAGWSKPEVDAINVLDIVTGDWAGRDEVYAHNIYRTNPFDKLSSDRARRALRTSSHKFIAIDGDDAHELYDLVADPNEAENRFSDSEGIAADLKARIRQSTEAQRARAIGDGPREMDLTEEEVEHLEGLGYL